ncbi:MAG: ABC transporter ATP-binding protein [Leptospirales bacterium]
MLKIESVTKSFRKKKVLNNITLNVKPGEVVALAGPNGVGKTTLLNLIAGISSINEGSVTIDSIPLKNYLRRNRGIGYFQQDFLFFNHRTFADQLNLFFDLAGYSKIQKEEFLERWISDMNLQPHYKEKIKNLSHGTVVKLNFLQTIIGSPEILLFDEPFSGLDVEQTILVRKYLRKIKTQSGIAIISSHDLHLLDNGLCNRFVFLQDGEIVRSLSEKEIQENYMTIVCSEDESEKLYKKLFGLHYNAKVIDIGEPEVKIVVECKTKEIKNLAKKEAGSLRIIERSDTKDIYRLFVTS